MIFIAIKQNQVTARRIEDEKPVGWETKIFLYVALDYFLTANFLEISHDSMVEAYDLPIQQ